MYIGKRATLAILAPYKYVEQRPYYYSTANQVYRAACILENAGYRNVTQMVSHQRHGGQVQYSLLCQDAEGNSYHIGEPPKGE